MRFRALTPAKDELLDAIEYFNLQQPGLGYAFREDAWAAFKRIRAFPAAWHPLGGNIRRCLLVRLPYGVIYQLFPAEIVVIAVACLYQRPEYWRDRVEIREPSFPPYTAIRRHVPYPTRLI